MPSTSKVISLKIAGTVGQSVNLRNRTTGEVMETFLQSTTKHVVDLSNFSSGWSDGDVIDVMCSGAKLGTGEITIDGNSPQTLTITPTAILAAISRGI